MKSLFKFIFIIIKFTMVGYLSEEDVIFFNEIKDEIFKILDFSENNVLYYRGKGMDEDSDVDMDEDSDMDEVTSKEESQDRDVSMGDTSSEEESSEYNSPNDAGDEFTSGDESIGISSEEEEEESSEYYSTSEDEFEYEYEYESENKTLPSDNNPNNNNNPYRGGCHCPCHYEADDEHVCEDSPDSETSSSNEESNNDKFS